MICVQDEQLDIRCERKPLTMTVPQSLDVALTGLAENRMRAQRKVLFGQGQDEPPVRKTLAGVSSFSLWLRVFALPQVDTGVIEACADAVHIPPREARDWFYMSEVYKEIREGVSDTHCRSGEYLAEEMVRDEVIGSVETPFPCKPAPGFP